MEEVRGGVEEYRVEKVEKGGGARVRVGLGG